MKRVYISAFVLSTLAGTIYAFLQVFQLSGKAADQGLIISWLGLAVALLMVFRFFGSLFLWRTPRTARIPILETVSVLGAILLSVIFQQGEITGYSFMLLLGWAVYNVWYARLDRPDAPKLGVGKEFPAALSFRNADGSQVKAGDYLGKINIWLFFRGNWCPLCMAQIKEVAAGYRELEARGAQVILVSPQSDRHTKWLSEQHEAPMVFLQDVNAQAAKSLNIVAPDGTPLGMEVFGFQADTVLPTVVITDAAGVIQWADQTDDYRVRPEPSTFLEVIDGFAAV